MKYCKIIVLFALIGIFACKTTKTDEPVFEVVEVPPQYPGGDEARQKFIVQNLVYPPLAVENNKQGTVYIKFIVEKDGSVSNPEAVKSFDEDCAKEAIRVVKLMKWKPGEQRGKKVRVRMILPIKFKLN
jgi:periplasmic protein TonB